MIDWNAAASVALTGLILVFAVLGLLNVAVISIGKIFEAREKKKNQAETQ